MVVKVKFDIDNHAFVDSFQNELEMVLQQVFGHLNDGNTDVHKLRDSNGNVVGTAQITEDDDETAN